MTDQLFAPGDVVKHKLGFYVVVLEVNPEIDGVKKIAVKGVYAVNRQLVERLFYWQELSR